MMDRPVTQRAVSKFAEGIDLASLADVVVQKRAEAVDGDKDNPKLIGSLTPLKNGWRTFPSADLARYSISAINFGSTQMPL